MNLPAENKWVLKPATEKPYNISYVAGMCALLMVLIIGRALDTRVLYVFMAVSGAVFLCSSSKHCVTILFLLMPFSLFLKPNPSGMTFFTILFFLTVAKMTLAHRKISLGLLLSAAAFLVYHFIFSGLQELTTVITMISGTLMLYYMHQENVHFKTIVFALVAGICLSSILAMLRGSLPLVNTFIREFTVRMSDGEHQSRFSGFTGNPNYYTMSIVMVQSALLVLIHQEKKQTLYISCFVLLSVFGFMSVSKSFLVTWIMLVFFWFIISAKKGINALTKFVFIGIIGLAIISFFAFDYLVAFADRLLQDEQGTLSNVTTGRTDIWQDYIQAIFSDVKILFFGNGVNTVPFKKTTHNTYIETIFFFGLVGAGILCAMLRAGLQKVITAKIMWIPVLTLLVRLMAIGYITQDELWFHLGLLVLLAKYCETPQEQKDISDVVILTKEK